MGSDILAHLVGAHPIINVVVEALRRPLELRSPKNVKLKHLAH